MKKIIVIALSLIGLTAFAGTGKVVIVMDHESVLFRAEWDTNTMAFVNYTTIGRLRGPNGPNVETRGVAVA
ncbi:MAG: hypothetical protein AAF492_30820, partial [Verrucomicrobiota bacterium]